MTQNDPKTFLRGHNTWFYDILDHPEAFSEAHMAPVGLWKGVMVVHHDTISCNIPMGSVLRSFGAYQGNIWSVAPFIPVGLGEYRWKNTKMQYFFRMSVNFLKNCIKPLVYMYILKGSGSNLRVTENLGPNGFVAVCAPNGEQFKIMGTTRWSDTSLNNCTAQLHSMIAGWQIFVSS